MQNTTLVVKEVTNSSKPASCQGCPYYLRDGIKWGQGHPEARVAFVFDKPPSEGSLRILDNSLRREGLNRHREFTTSCVKCEVKPGEAVDWQALKACKPLLDQELASFQGLKVIATMGETPFKEFTNKTITTVTNRKKENVWLRGCPWPFGHRKVIVPTMGPSHYAQSGFVTSYEFDMDIGKVKRYANGQGLFYLQQANYNPTDAEVRDCLDLIRNLGRGGLDIETPEDMDEDELAAGGKDLPIDVVGVSPFPDVALGIRPDQYHILGEYFTNPLHRIRWYVFNESFDFYHLGKRFGKLPGVEARDVMLHLNVWRSDLRKKDLGMAMSFFTDMEYTKNLAKFNPTKYQWADTCGVLEAGLKIEEVLRFQNLLHVSLQQDHTLNFDLTGELPDGLNKMRELGVKTDLREVFKFLRVSQDTLKKYEEVWYRHFPTIDWQAPKQLGELFVGVFKLPVIMKTRVKKKDGQVERKKTPSCDVDALEEYRDKHGNKTADLVLKMRTIKHLGDFAGIIRPDTNRIHTGYAIHRQVQRRIQAFDPNLQTLPEELAGFQTRRMVIPDTDDDEIISMDASQLELRIYAYLAGAKNLLAAMESGEYIYGTMYEQIFGKPYWRDPQASHVKSNRAEYVTVQEVLAAKSGPLGFIYDRFWKSLVTAFGLPDHLAKAAYDGFHGPNPEIKEFHRKVDADVKQLGYQTNLWGARRYFPLGKTQRPEYLSFHGQSNGAELLRVNYLIPSFKHLHDFGARVLLTVHDSMAINVPKRNTYQVAQFLFDHAEAPIPEMNGFVIPCELKHGPTWADCKQFKTERRDGRTVVCE